MHHVGFYIGEGIDGVLDRGAHLFDGSNGAGVIEGIEGDEEHLLGDLLTELNLEVAVGSIEAEHLHLVDATCASDLLGDLSAALTSCGYRVLHEEVQNRV